MFCDSFLAKKFNVKQTQLGYFIDFNIAPIFRNILIDKVKILPYDVIPFDQS